MAPQSWNKAVTDYKVDTANLQSTEHHHQQLHQRQLQSPNHTTRNCRIASKEPTFIMVNFYPHDAMLAQVLAVIMRLSVRVSHAGTVSKWLNVGSSKQRHVIAQGLVFWHQESLVDNPLSPRNLCSKWPTPHQTTKFRPISAHSVSTITAGEKSSIIANRKSTTRFPTSHRWTVYVTPKSPKGCT